MPDLPRRFAEGPPIPGAAIASALVLHAAGLGALMAFGYGIPAQPAPAVVVEVAMVLEPTPPEPQPLEPQPTEPQPAEPTPVASAPVPDPQVAEPVAPPLPEPPVAAPSPVIAIVEPPIPDNVPEPTAPVPPPVDMVTLPDPAPPIPPAPPPMRPPVRLQPMRPPMQHAPQPASAAPRSINVPRDSAAGAAPATSKPLSAGTPESADQEAALETRIRDAVQAAVRYPPAARMMGVTGRARVRFDYRSGSVADPMLAQSSGTPMLDDAALAAARAAHYPPAPAPIEGRLLRLLVWVEFRPG